jgi:hypothetical protein
LLEVVIDSNDPKESMLNLDNGWLCLAKGIMPVCSDYTIFFNNHIN